MLYSDPSKTIIELKDSRRRPFKDELKNMGLSPTLSRRYSRDSGRNISILKRLTSSSIVSPEWVNDEYMDVLITLAFIGSWIDSFNDDLRIIDSLSGMDYGSFSHKCHNLLNEPNSPLLKIGTVWILKSSKDLLYLILRYIADEDLEKFKNVILKIFYVLKECIITQKFTRLHNHSSILLRRILKSLILLSVYGEDFNINSLNISSYVNGIVYYDI